MDARDDKREPTRSFAEWLQEIRKKYEGTDDGYERERGWVLPEEEKQERGAERGGRGR